MGWISNVSDVIGKPYRLLRDLLRLVVAAEWGTTAGKVNLAMALVVVAGICVMTVPALVAFFFAPQETFEFGRFLVKWLLLYGIVSVLIAAVGEHYKGRYP